MIDRSNPSRAGSPVGAPSLQAASQAASGRGWEPYTPTRNEILLVLLGCLALSLIAILWSWRNNAMLNYGDAVAHLHIARRVFDSHRPGFTQLGSVWLPLPHILMMPFVAVFSWWANGIAGLIPSALAYLVACVGFYRLVRNWLPPASSALALAFFALNPNLLYLQTTAMTEPLFVCETIWVALWLVRWRRALDSDLARARRLQPFIAFVLVAAVYTRYDGWIVTLLAWTAMGISLLRRRQLRQLSYWLCTALLIAAPLAWFVYNAAAFGDWLFFARGPYSAKAIEIRTSAPGFPPHPGWHDPWVSFLFYMKAALLDAVALNWGVRMLSTSLIGTAWAVLMRRRRAFVWALLLWFPVPFYAYSISWGSVPIFLPVWWPHSFYNTRYGMELLPALALGLGSAAHIFLSIARDFKPRWTAYAAAVLFAAVALNAWQMTREHPIVYVEGTKNIEARRAYDEQIPPVLRTLRLRHPGPVLAITSVYPEIFAFSGIPLRQTINESDKEFYQAALAEPAAHAAIVLAFQGDDVDRAIQAHPGGLTLVRRFSTPGQQPGALYISATPPAR